MVVQQLLSPSARRGAGCLSCPTALLCVAVNGVRNACWPIFVIVTPFLSAGKPIAAPLQDLISAMGAAVAEA